MVAWKKESWFLKTTNKEWQPQWEEVIDTLVDMLPSGSGIDRGVKIDFDKSTGEKLVFNFGYHHMDENGYYCGWTEHVLTITPSFLSGFNMKISGPDKNGIKEYLYETFGYSLDQELPEEAKV